MKRSTPILLILLAACSNEAPKGQVIARVNGTEITRRELMAEMRARNMPADPQGRTHERLLLEQIIDRKLIAAQAREALVERSPEFQISRRRGDEIALADILLQRLGTRIAVPNARMVERYIAENPYMFELRMIVVVDRLVVDSKNARNVSQLRASGDLDAIQAMLLKTGLAFGRDQTIVDTRALPTHEARILVTRSPGKGYWTDTNSTVEARRVVTSWPFRTSSTEHHAAASAALVELGREAIKAALLRNLRQKAYVEYNPSIGQDEP